MNEDDELLFTSDMQVEQKSTRARGQFVSCLSDRAELHEINKNFFLDEGMNIFLSILINLVCITIAALSILPYTTYQRQLLIGDWVLFCILRPSAYLIVFFSTWHKLLIRENMYWGIWRIIISFVFAGVYTTLYIIKWVEADEILIRYVSLPCLSLSWFLVFYEVMDRHMSSRSYSDSSDMRRRKILLLLIREQEKACWSVEGFSKFVYDSLEHDKNVSILVCKHRDVQILHSSESEDVRLGMYENVFFNLWEGRISSIVSLEIGFSMIPLTLSIVEDYAYSLYRLIQNEDIFLALSFIFCVIFSCLYLLTTHPIYHGMLNIIIELTRDPRGTIFSFCRRIPLFVFSGIIAMTRMNASYSIFGSIAGRMSIPIGMGLFLVWFSVITVALVDFSATLKILSRSVKYTWMILLMKMEDLFSISDYLPSCMRDEVYRSLARYHSKRLKRMVRNMNTFDLSYLITHLL